MTTKELIKEIIEQLRQKYSLLDGDAAEVEGVNYYAADITLRQDEVVELFRISAVKSSFRIKPKGND